MNKITVDLADGRNFVINSQEGITVTLPSVSTVNVISDDEIGNGYDKWIKTQYTPCSFYDAFFAGAKFVIQGGKL